MSGEDSEILLPYVSIRLDLGETDASLTAMCNGVRLYIEINLDKSRKSEAAICGLPGERGL